MRLRASATGDPRVRAAGFTLVELLAVVAIMAVVMGILGVSLRQAQGPVTRVAAAQVASGFSLARQVAIARNTEARFVIAPVSGAPGSGLPGEPFRYWAVIYSNKSASAATNSWIMEKDWESLPNGAIFLNLATTSYNTINWDEISIAGNQIGVPRTPQLRPDVAEQEWQSFSSFGPHNITFSTNSVGTNAALVSILPYVAFRPDGRARFSAGAGASQSGAVRVAQGSASAPDRIALATTNDAFYIETDQVFGKVRVRGREAYR
jgi:prepilin-type N-terminal cleavage/methylation domain-containing protein